jgi:centromeric protein E
VQSTRAGDDLVRVSMLDIVDLAGSERVNQAGTHGTSLQEGSHINKSLLVLGRCIEKLSNSRSRGGAGYVPFRDSKLTRILQVSILYFAETR